ncbi:MAG: hypothetical protein WBC44_01055, partial [Planctomycetaceae bacterium]
MARTIDPPRSEFETLPTPLTVGERRLIDLFDERLPLQWEFYVQPHLNGLRPDLVILNPTVGIGIFEVKDWDFDAIRYFAEWNASTERPFLMAEDRHGKRFSREHENPITKIRLYKDELFNIYCPRLRDKLGICDKKAIAAITGGVVFTCARKEELERVFAPFRT